MKKRLPIALVASLILFNGASVALADHGSGHKNTATSTTVPSAKGKSKSVDTTKATKKETQDDAIAKYRAELAKYREAREMIDTTFKTAIIDATKARKAALKSATTPAARNAAAKAFNTAVSAATKTKNAALKALGPVPKPVKP